MSANDAYDKLTPEEREARDKADRAREVAEQAGRALSDRQPHRVDSRFFLDSVAIPLDAAARRCGHNSSCS